MQILSLQIENILSIESASLSFEDKGLVLVEGWNYDADRANGAGKSAIFNCICFALFDKVPRKITASEILRRDTKKGMVSIKLLCSADEWTVIRKRPKEVKFFKNGIEQSITQLEFESIVGVSYDQFMVTAYNAQAVGESATRFLSCSDTDKKAFLLKLLNLEKFDSYRKNADSISKKIGLSLLENSSKLESIKAKKDAYEESLVDESHLKLEIDDINSQVESLNSQAIKHSSVERPNLDKFLKLEEDIKSKLLDITKAKTKREILFREYRKIESMRVEDTCFNCGSKIESQNADEHLKESKRLLLDLKGQIDDLDAAILKENEVTTLATKIKDKKRAQSSDYEKARDCLLDINGLIKSKALELNNLNLKLKNNELLISKINSLTETGTDLTNLIEQNKRELEFYKTLCSIYSPTGAQAYVLDSIIDYFNESVQKYIETLWPNASYILNSYKETAKGETTAKFSETLTMGGQVTSVGSLSGGEFRALSLCVDFALLDVINNQFSISLNPIILDEPFDGLDASGREIVINLLDTLSKDRQILVVDHASESKVLFSKVIRVEKKNGISTIDIDIDA